MTVYEGIKKFGFLQFRFIGWDNCYSLKCRQSDETYSLKPKYDTIGLFFGGLIGLLIFILTPKLLNNDFIGVSFILSIFSIIYTRIYFDCRYLKIDKKV